MSRSLTIFTGARVLVTGHTGFKGAWLAAFLHELGAEVHGYSLPPPERGAFFDLEVASFARTLGGDVRDAAAVAAAVAASQPQLVFHLAAQPLVRESWDDRRTTFETNVMGTVNTVEAALSTGSVAGVVVVTTDKVYENNESGQAFVETDRLGGHDPYSASKAAAELVLAPYRRAGLMGLRDAPVVSVRAGNVIGGGDWAPDRLIPDIARAIEANDKVVLRRPNAVRPWQHVLDCVYGYLLLGAAMLDGQPLAPSYNFASADPPATVLDVARTVLACWDADETTIVVEVDNDAKESGVLLLDSSLARRDLGWEPAWPLEPAIAETVRFYRDATLGPEQIRQHMALTASR